ncbi:hypothetical protein ACIP93_33945 [Streptomyces sp. NPDC088745]|uniref:hypothetical protein n=1 Tax=Streptomyces sp. NPDC088745 TaxID=3365884 RepID=UPI003803451B
MSADTATPLWIRGRLVMATTQFDGTFSHEKYAQLAEDLVVAAEVLLPQVDYGLVEDYRRREVQRAFNRAGQLVRDGCTDPGDRRVLRDFCRDLGTALKRVQLAIPQP